MNHMTSRDLNFFENFKIKMSKYRFLIIIRREVTKPIEDSTRRNKNIIKDTACDKNFTYGEAMKTLKSIFKLML